MTEDKDTAQSADVRIAISDDGMQAVVEAYVPPGPGQPPLSAAVLSRRLRDRNVTAPPGPDFERVLSNAQRGKDIRGEVVARGVPPMEPVDARIRFSGDLALPVLHGDVIATLTPAQKPTPGTSVTGTPVLPKSDRKPDEIECPESRGCLLDGEAMTISAKGYGLVDFRERKVVVKPLLRISPDRLQIQTRIYPAGFDGRPITVERFKRDLWQMGVQTAEDEAIAQALALAANTGEPVEDVVVAKGTPPRHGKDGRFEVLLKDDSPTDDAKDLDPRERSIFKQVREGTLLGRLHPPREGKFGRDVFGEDLVPRRGQPAEIVPGENVSVGGNGVDFVADIAGMVTWEGNRISVLEMVHIPGDVDYSTGNVRLERGTVRVDGSVRDGFVVAAPGDIVIGGAAEGCRLVSGGCVAVGGGVVQGGMGRVQARRDVTAAFIENSTVEAGGDVTVAQNVANSVIKAGGRLRCVRGKGVLFGGELTVARGLEVNELGTEFGVKTLVCIDAGLDLDDDSSQILTERRGLREKRVKIEGAIGADSPRAILERTPPAKRQEVAKLLKLRIAICQRLQEIESELEQRRQALEIYPELRIKVRRRAHPGVIISIAGKNLMLHESCEACTFFFDPGTMAIVKE